MRRFKLFIGCTLLTLAIESPVVAASPVTIHYGQVIGIEVTTRESAMARNMLIGSLVGWAVLGDSSGAISGAVAGFALTSLVENDKRVFAYTMSFADGTQETVAVERPDLSIGHCAALERDGNHVNLRPVSAVHCDDDSKIHDEDEPGGEHRMSAAEKCSEARRVLTGEQSGADIQVALRNMRAFCD
jgi:hypothetical protein